MKALNLKSMSWIMVLAMMFIVSFSGCSDDNDETENGGNKVEFPALQETTLNADGTLQISFKANADWKLTSTAGWCKFVNGDFTESTISGKASEQTITAKVSGDGQNYTDDHVAEIKLAMDGKEEVIYKITRPKKEFKGLTIKDEEGKAYNTENPIIIKGSGFDNFNTVYTTIILESEFEVGISENPDWVAITSKGEGKYDLTFKNSNKENLNPKYSFTTEKGYKLIMGVKTSDGEEINVSVPVAYEGLKENILVFEPEYINALTLSDDGKTFTEVSSGSTGSTEAKYENQLSSTVTVRNDKFHVLKITEIKASLMGTNFYTYDVTEEPDWITITQEEATLTLTANALPEGTEARGAAILVFPETIWDKIKDTDLQKTLFTRDSDNGAPMDYLKEEYTTYMWTHFTQEPLKEETEIILTGFYTTKAINDWSQVQESDLTPFDNSDQTLLKSEYPGQMAEIAWNASLSKELLKDGKSVCIQANSMPTGNQFEIMYNPWAGEVNIENKTINGKEYMVLTGYPTSANFEPIMAAIGEFETPTIVLECNISFY